MKLAPKFSFRRKPTAYGKTSLLRYLFPHSGQRARAHFTKFRLEVLPSLRYRTQSRIYRYILHREALKLRRKPGIFDRLRGHTRKLLGRGYLENEALRRRQKIIQARGLDESNKTSMASQDYGSGAAREPGARRRKFAGYLRAANELRQTYQQQYSSGWNRGETAYNDYEDNTPGGFPDAAVVRNGDEEMIMFPSYARKHVKSKPQAEPGTIQEVSGSGRDVRDTSGAGDAEFWRQQWDSYEDDNAIVDVDVRGWIYSPHKGQMTRKQRLFIGMARQLVGIQAPPAGTKPTLSSQNSSRDPSPSLGHRERAQIRAAQRDEALTAKEAEEILRRGEKEADIASKGGYSEMPPPNDTDNTDLYPSRSRDSIRSLDNHNPHRHHLSHSPSSNSIKSEDTITAVQRRKTWNQPADMSPGELAEANSHLMARLQHFLAIPMANTPISVFFYNEDISKQRTVYTNPSGHFNIRAALDFIPTHVRILASENLSATEEIIITEPSGVSVISDIDDTIKHSAIGSGAREIFRNAFIRELGDLTIEGVREWYGRMAEMGVKFHYVSNSPWQLFPVISKYFEMAGLPAGSFHLKQYSGMLQGIFEPVAERKKSTLDKIARDFPERSFILVGDSGEADLEVYTDFVLENPGRVLAVFIRDVTTPIGGGFFDPSVGLSPNDTSGNMSHQGGRNNSQSTAATSRITGEDDDPELRAAIEASLRDMEDENRKHSAAPSLVHDEDHPERRPKLPPRRTQPAPTEPIEKLIDLSDEEPGMSPLRRTVTDTVTQSQEKRNSVASTSSAKTMPPAPPRKPIALRSNSSENSSTTPTKAPPPPKPRRLSSNVHASSPLSNNIHPQDASRDKPHPGPKPPLSRSQQSYAGAAREKLSAAYNSLPAIRSTTQPPTNDSTRTPNVALDTVAKKSAPPPPPSRRGVSSYPAAAASYASNKVASAWNNPPSMPHPTIRSHTTQPQANFSTSSSTQSPARTNNTNLGLNGGSNGNATGLDGQQLNKREMLWRQRWARAEQVLGEKGVVLRSWRIGTDVLGEAERLIKKYEREIEKNSRNGKQ